MVETDSRTFFKLIPTVRGGATNSPLASKRYASLEEARAGARQLIHENNRVMRIMIVEGEPPRVAEWIERA